VHAGYARERAFIETDRGRLQARAVVAADGLRSTVARLAGWARPALPPHRYALVGHLAAPDHGLSEIVVTLMPGIELYTAPAGEGEVLCAVLGPKGRLRGEQPSVRDGYLATVAAAHPELAAAPITALRGCGPFRRKPSRVAAGRLFLAGDAAGFLDPLTGDAMAAGLAAAKELAGLLASDPASAAARYSRWHATQWRQRKLVTWLALFLTGGPARATRALSGVRKRPEALESLIEVNGGLRELRQVRLRHWLALAGL
jgi:flavin-dependent dehydrogenase